MPRQTHPHPKQNIRKRIYENTTQSEIRLLLYWQEAPDQGGQPIAFYLGHV